MKWTWVDNILGVVARHASCRLNVIYSLDNFVALPVSVAFSFQPPVLLSMHFSQPLTFPASSSIFRCSSLVTSISSRSVSSFFCSELYFVSAITLSANNTSLFFFSALSCCSNAFVLNSRYLCGRHLYFLSVVLYCLYSCQLPTVYFDGLNNVPSIQLRLALVVPCCLTQADDN